MPSHLPIRRLLGSWNLPVRRMGIGDMIVIPRQTLSLDSRQIEDFLNRHPDTKSTVEQFENLVLRFGYRQGAIENRSYPIPEWGTSVRDVAFTNVVIFPNADGQLLYTGNVSDSTAAEIIKARYESPRGDEPNPLTLLLYVAGAFLTLSVVNTVRGR